MKDIIVVIPARYASSRFPGKPLYCIKNKPMIQWVYEAVQSIDIIKDVYVATDDERIYNCVESFNGKAIMTSSEHNSGTDRIYEAITKIEENIDIIINVQGDEPLIKKEMILQLISCFNEDDVCMATLKKEIKSADIILDSNIPKVITDKNDNAIYFSRAPIPFNRDSLELVKYYKHIGIYGYTREFLKEFTMLPESNLEKIEKLEQLRAIENGYNIKVKETEYESIGVDLPEHILEIERLLIEN